MVLGHTGDLTDIRAGESASQCTVVTLGGYSQQRANMLILLGLGQYRNGSQKLTPLSQSTRTKVGASGFILDLLFIFFIFALSSGLPGLRRALPKSCRWTGRNHPARGRWQGDSGPASGEQESPTGD